MSDDQIDLTTPRRMSIPARYGVEVPRAALARILAAHMGADAALEVLASLHQAKLRYRRAVRVEEARRFVARTRAPASRPRDFAEKLARRQAILDNARAYIDGEWRPA